LKPEGSAELARVVAAELAKVLRERELQVTAILGISAFYHDSAASHAVLIHSTRAIAPCASGC
jgi:hypothetical protein